MNRARTTFLLLLAGFAMPSLAQPPDGYARAREVLVDAPGWIATRLDAEVAAHVGVDLTVLAPDGRSLRVYRLGDQEGRRGVQVTSLDRGREGDRSGRWVSLDLGAEPPRHFRLEFVSAQRVEAADCVLQASGDGRTWSELVRGGLFRLGDDAALQRLALDYPASDARYLRLFWPDSAGMPALERVNVLAEGDTAESIEVPAACTVAETRRTCRLQLSVPARQARRLDLAVQDSAAFGWRLWSAQNGSWRLLSEGTRQRTESETEDRVVRITLDDGDRWKLLSDTGDPALWLELWGESSPPVLTTARLLAARSAVAFEAQVAGRHVVAWGASRTHGAFTEGAPEGEVVADQATRRVAWVDAGDTLTAPWPAIDPRLAAPGKDFDPQKFSRSWPVVFDAGSKPGDVVRLVFDQSERTGSNLTRLAHGGRLVPCVDMQIEEPTQAWSARLRPEAREDSQQSLATVAGFPGGEAAYSQILLRAPGPFHRALSVGTTEPGQRGRAPTRRFLVHSTQWSCQDSGPLPCVHDQSATVAGFGETDLELAVDDGDNLPLPWVDLELWRPRAAIVFVVPAGVSDEVPLWVYAADPEAGDPRPKSPRFDLESLSVLLRLRPHVPAHLGVAEASAEAPAIPVGWLLYGAVAVAVLVLLALLGRMLREPAGG